MEAATAAAQAAAQAREQGKPDPLVAPSSVEHALSLRIFEIGFLQYNPADVTLKGTSPFEDNAVMHS